MYILKGVLCLNAAGLLPAVTQSCDQTSVHPLTPFESPPSADMEMLLAEHIFQTLVPPVCCHQCHTVHPPPCGTLFVCSSWLNTHFQNLVDVFTGKQRQMAVNEFRRLMWTCQAVFYRAFSQAGFCERLLSLKLKHTSSKPHETSLGASSFETTGARM